MTIYSRSGFAMLSVVLATCLAAPACASDVLASDETFAFDKKKPAVGTWLGFITPPNGLELTCQVVVQEDDGKCHVSVTCLALGALRMEASRVELDDRTMTFALPTGGDEVSFTAELSQDMQRMTGTCRRAAATDDTEGEAELALRRVPQPTELAEYMAFSGALPAPGFELDMTIVLARTPRGNWVGHLDVPVQQLREYPLIRLADIEGVISATLPVPAPATLELKIADDKGRLTGTFSQGGFDLPIDFLRDENYAYRELPRPQHPKPPYPYEERELAVDHPAGFKLAGTLTIPDKNEHGPGPYPAAILISGSGQQDRDETIFGHKPFLVIADHLTRRGIAVMRYDDRGVGGSGGLDTLEEVTSEDFAGDSAAILKAVRAQKDIDTDRVGVIGHSEGAMIALLLAQEHGPAFIVLMAGPGVTGRDLLVEQTRLLSIASGMDEDTADGISVQYDEILGKIIKGEDDERIKAMMRRAVEEQQAQTGISAADEEVDAAIRAQFNQLTGTWMRYFLVFDPQPLLRDTTCPVLALNGTLDLQVWHEQNLDAIQRIMSEAGGDITIKRYGRLNHLFQPAVTGAVGEYGSIEVTIDEAVLIDLAAWVLQVVKPAE